VFMYYQDIVLFTVLHYYTCTSLVTGTHEGEIVLKYLIITYGKHEGGVLH